MDYNSKEVCAALKKVNIKSGDIILCHSNLGFFGKPSKIKTSQELCKMFFKALKGNRSCFSRASMLLKSSTWAT